ncbi:iron hydrogenase small subunit [Desulfomicrobium orale]|uniref:Iron hydrogenase n=1 Tax=Desulfomicrobium orale DSM 12838 TaxID=888061 RepID=A0A0X8JNY1_9BACT|nr:iron hydrogenase small subunit [Desulfomicrobium orale]AMD92230.1 iron hydrogenase [Desulfomicrobium orale DSM 12838]
MINVSRRFILKGGLILGGATLLGLRFTSRALAKGKELKDWMGDRIGSVYAADKAFPVRASQDNTQVQALYKNFLGEPGSHVSHQFLHMHFTDRSKNIGHLKEAGNYPNPRAAEFEGNTYPYE